MPKSLMSVSRGLLELSVVRERGNRFGHDVELRDPRSAAEHRVAHQRSLDESGEGCPSCN